MLTNIFCVILSFGMIFPPLIDKWGTLGLDEETFSCTIKRLDGKSPKKFLFLVAFLLPTVVIVTCYSAIFYKIKTTRKTIESHSFRTPDCPPTQRLRLGVVLDVYRIAPVCEDFRPPSHLPSCLVPIIAINID